MSGRFRLRKISQQLHRAKPDEPLTIPGELGLRLGGERLVEVPSRPGFVYVRLRNDQSEVVQAFNDRVTPIYGLPVTVVRDRVDRGRYYITGRDTGRYNNWGSSAYLPRHGAMHSWNPDAPGIDPVWVYSRQFMPMLGVPSGSSASMNVLVYPGTLYYDNRWIYAGMTGTPDLTSYRPTGANARMILIYMDQDGNPQLQPGSYFSASLTGSQQVYPYLPAMPGQGVVPIAGVRLLSGSTSVTWDNLYDLRQFLHWGVFTGTAGSGGDGGHTIQYNATPLTTRAYLNFVGPNFYVFDDPVNGATVVSGSSSTTQVGVATNNIAFGTANGLTGTAMFKVQTPSSTNGRTNVYLNSSGLDEWGYMQNFGFNVVSLDRSADRGIAIWSYISGTSVFDYRDYPPLLEFNGLRGTQSTPQQVLSGTVVGQINFRGRTTNDNYLGGMLKVAAVATGIDGYVNSVMQFTAGGSGTTQSQVHLNPGLELYLDRMIGYVPITVTTGTNQGYYWGNIFTNGSWRSVVANDRVEFQKRVAGAWVTQGYSNTGSSGGGGHTIQDDGTPLTARANLNFVGSAFVAYDDGSSATIVSGVATSSFPAMSPSRVAYTDPAGALTTNPFFNVSPYRYDSTYPSVIIGGITGTIKDSDIYMLNVVADDIAAPLTFANYGYFGSYPVMDFVYNNGTPTGSATTLEGDRLGQINWKAIRDTDSLITVARIEVEARQDFYINSGTATEMRLLVNPINGSNFYSYPAVTIRGERTIFSHDVEISVTGSYYFGNPNTDGSWRSQVANNRIEFQKRVGGVWVTQGYSNSGSASGGSAHVVQDDGTPLTQRANLNFVGSGFVVYDDAGNDATVVSGTATGGGSFTGTVTGYAANDLTWQVDGALYTGTNVVTPFIIPRPGRITNVLAYAANLGVTGSTVVDITKNGVSIFGVSKPTLAYNGASYVEGAPTTTDLAKGDVLALNILGFAPSARDLTVTVVNETTGSATNLSGTIPHTMLSDLNTATYWHLTQTERNALVTGATTDLHSHAIVDQFLMAVYPFIKVFDDTNGFTVQTSGTASFTTGWPIAVAATGATSGSRVTINATAGIFVYNNVQQYYTRYRIDLHTVTTVESSCTIWAGLFTNPGSPAATESHMAFKIVNGDIYASCGNGTNGNLVDTGLNFSQFNRRRLEIKQVGTDIEYYIDSNLVHTFTTYAPTAVQLKAAVQIGNSTAANKSINVYPLMIVQGQL